MVILRQYTSIAAIPLLGLLSSLATAQADTLLIEHNFSGGAGDYLNDTAVDGLFHSTVLDAGGSNVWKAEVDQGDPWTGFKADGSAAVFRSNASINLGSYINDAKGETDGIFVLTATMAQATATDWYSLGFGVDNEPLTREEPEGGTSQHFFNEGSLGMGQVVYRVNGDIDLFPGPGISIDTINAATGQTGDQTFEIELDLSSWDGLTGFGTVTWSQNGTQIGNYSYTEDNTFGSILLSTARIEDGKYSDLSLVQIPEPSTYAIILGLLGLGLCGAKRRLRK